MIAAYYDKSCDSHSLFESYYISHTKDYKKNINQYVVIYLDISAFIAQGTVELVKTCLMTPVIEELQEIYSTILRKRYTDLSYTLAEINDKTGEKFVIIIDEWDAIFRTERFNAETRQEYLNCLYGLFKSSLSKRFLALGYLTGVFPLKKYNLGRTLNNFVDFTIMNPVITDEYFGFTEKEVKKLCRQYQRNFQEIEHWYGGCYHSKENRIYRMDSVVKILFHGFIIVMG